MSVSKTTPGAQSLQPQQGSERPVSEAASTPSFTAQQLRVLQRRTVWVLVCATVLGGLGTGASLSAGALLIADITGNEALSGFGSTMNALGAALAGVPLARLAARRGRRFALASGNAGAILGALTVILAAGLRIPILLFVGLAVLGVASAVGLQSRFAATDLALPERRGRDLSLVVWSITLGAVTGPNLIGPGQWVGAALGLPGLAGIFVFTLAAQVCALIVVLFGLRPDPLLLSRGIASAPKPQPQQASSSAASSVETLSGTASARSSRPQFLAIFVIAVAHAVMVGLMAMTPMHLHHHGGTVTLIGFTLSIHIAGMYALSPVFGWLTGRIGAPRLALLGLAVLLLAALGTAVGGANIPVIQAALVLLGVGWSMVTIAGSTLLTNITPAAVRPARQGQSDTTMNAAGALFGAVSGSLFVWGGFPVLSIVAVILVVVAMLVTVQLARGRSRR